MPTTFANTIDGNDIYAKRAECDAAGNDLSTTYATKSELPDGVPTVTSSDNNKVLKASYSGGVASYSWQNESGGGGGGTQADWAESDPTDPSYIENKPVPKTLVAGTGITITESSTELTVASTNQLYSAGNGLTLNNATFAVDTSVVATQNDLSTGLASKQGTLTAGANITIDANNEISATDTTYSAGTGIQISNQNVIEIGSDYIVTTEETIGSYSIGGSDVSISKTISKTGYRPIAWMHKFGYAASISFNEENTQINANNELEFQGYARSTGSTYSITFKLFVTWVKVTS